MDFYLINHSYVYLKNNSTCLAEIYCLVTLLIMLGLAYIFKDSLSDPFPKLLFEIHGLKP